MGRIVKAVVFALGLVLATTLVSCGRPDPTGLTLKNGLRAQVGLATQVEPYLDYFGSSDGGPTDDQRAGDRRLLQWSVQPSDGASISSEGVLKATKPGVYTVTVKWDARSRHLSASTKVYATEPESTTTTEEESTETTQTTETTETTVANRYAGTYKGSWVWKAGSDQADVPWGFVVESEGRVEGGFDCMLTADTRVVCVLTGHVVDDGNVDASGNADTTISGVGGTSTPMTLTGRIVDGEFTGELVGSGGKAVVVAATLQ